MTCVIATDRMDLLECSEILWANEAVAVCVAVTNQRGMCRVG